MTKKLTPYILGTSLCFATALNAQFVQDFQFNDAVDTALNNASNTGTIGTAFNFALGNPDQGYTDGNGSFVIGDDGVGGASSAVISTGYTRKVTFTDDAVSAGTYEFLVVLDSWNLTGGSALGGTQGQGLTVKIGGAETINLVFDWRATDNVRVRNAVSSGLGGSAAQQAGFNDSGTGLSFRVNGNLNDGSFTTSYSTNGLDFSDLITDGTGLTSISEILWVVADDLDNGTDTPWVAGEFIAVDSMSLNVVPEPGTYALLAGLLAMASVMIRRRK